MSMETLVAENRTLKQQNTALRHELDQLKRLIFAAKSERLAPATAPEQMALWDEGADAGAEDVEKQSVTYRRRKKSAHAGRRPLPDHLPVDEVIVEPEEDTEGMKCIGREVTDTLDYVPGSLRIKRTIRPKYVRPEAEQTEEVPTVVVADLPSRPIEKSIAEPGLLAHIFVAKYVDHQPFYRQIKGFCPRLRLETGLVELLRLAGRLLLAPGTTLSMFAH